MEIKDLKPGEIYTAKSNEDNYKLVFKKGIGIDSTRIDYENRVTDLDAGAYAKNSTHSWTVGLREATLEEKHWLNTCIEINGFISYEEALKTFKKEFKLPEKWCIKATADTKEIIHSTLEKLLSRRVYSSKGTLPYYHYPECEGFGYASYNICTSNSILENYPEITFEQFKKYVLNESDKKYKITKQNSDKILQVENEEGNIFDIGDKVKQSNIKDSKIVQTILGFRRGSNDSICAITGIYTKNGININTLEHHIEIKSKEFILPESWYVRCNKENQKILSKYMNLNSNFLIPEGNVLGKNNGKCDFIIKGTIGHNPQPYHRNNFNHIYYDKEITYEQFEEHILNKLPLIDQAKIKYPIGTIFNNSNLGISTGRPIEVIGHDFITSNTGTNQDLLINYDSCLNNNQPTGSWTIYRNGNWAEIIK